MKKYWMIFLLAMVADPLSAAGYKAPGREYLPEVKSAPQISSKVKWLWYPAEKIDPRGTARYRKSLILPENDPVVKAEIKLGLDDHGDFYCNGRKMRDLPFPQPDFQVKFRRFDISKSLTGGKNILAFEARNGAARGGLILRGEIELASGKKILLVSDESFKAAAASAKNKNFYRVDFDDSQWPGAWAFGDVNAGPWNRVSDVVNIFTSDAEKKEYYDKLDAIAVLPERIAGEKQSRARVVYKNGMACLELNGRTVPAVTWIVGYDPWNVAVGDQLVKLNRAGVKIFEYQTKTNNMLRGNNDYDFSFIDRDVRRILSLAPDAHLVIALRFDLFGQWMQSHPDDLIGYATGKPDSMSDLERRKAPSMASREFRAEMAKFTTAFVQYLQSRPWYRRVIGIRTSQAVFSEWHYYGMANHMPDTGKAMTAVFKDFLRKKYVTDQALAEAWKTPGLTFDQVTVPGTAERNGDKLYLRNPSLGRDRKVMDYYLCHSQVVADTLLLMASAVKKADPQMLTGAYYGYCFGFPYPAEGTTLELERVLASPYIDFLSAPFCYDGESRNVNGDSLSRSINYTFKRHGKLFMYESDTRTHLTRARTFGNARTPRESAETLKRTFAQMAVTGSGLQLLDLERNSGHMWFNHPQILTAVHESIAAYNQAFAVRRADTEAIAVVFNPLEVLQHDRSNTADLRRGMGKSLADNALHALNRSGYAYELMTLDDFLAGNKEYAVVIYLNAFTLNAGQIEALKKHSRRPGAVSIWCYAPGMVAPDGWSSSAMEELTGIKLDYSVKPRLLSVMFEDNCEYTALNNRNQPVTDAPVTFAVDKDAKVLARYENNDPAVVVKNLPGGARSIFAAVTPNHYAYWQRILAETPAEAIAPGGLVMNKSGNLVYVYTHQAGSWSLDLPEGTQDLFNSNLEFVNGKLQIKADGPRCFLLLVPQK